MLALLRRHGWNATSFQVLEPGFRYFFDGDDACVAYVDTGRAWVAAGAPIAPEARLAEVAARFGEAARRKGRRHLFFATERRFTRRAPLEALEVGEQPSWDPRAWEETLRASRSLREQLRRARAKELSVRVLGPDELEARRAEIERLVERWLGSRVLAPMGFLVHVDPFSFAEERRLLVAERKGRLVGFLAAVPVFGRGGWFLEDLLRDPAAPNGTAEALVDGAMRLAASEGSRYVTLGLAPLAGEVPGWLRLARSLGRPLYDFSGLRAFKAKLRPNAWSPIYVSYPPGDLPALAVLDALAAFARGSLLRFGVETLLRGPSPVVRALAVLLVPWTLALALAPAHLFPAPWVKWAWVAFDVALFAALLSLSRRWRPRLADLVVAAVTLDALVTFAQAALHNSPRVASAGEALAVAVAVAAPAFAALVLERARRRHAVLAG